MISSKYAMAKLKSFKMPVMSSWKYAGACASPKGTLTYSYLPNGELNAVFLVWRIYLWVYGANQLINPRLKNTLHYSI